MREFSEQEQVRREKLKNIKNPYPDRFEVNCEIADASQMEDGTTGIRVAGRIILMRKMGKMSFLTIGDILGKIQISVKVDMIGEEAYQEFKTNYDLGDFIGVEGEVFTTHTGEKTVRANSIMFLGKALKPLPIVTLIPLRLAPVKKLRAFNLLSKYSLLPATGSPNKIAFIKTNTI